MSAVIGPVALVLESASTPAVLRFVAHPDLVTMVQGSPCVVVASGDVADLYYDDWLARHVVLRLRADTYSDEYAADLARWETDGGGATS